MPRGVGRNHLIRNCVPGDVRLGVSMWNECKMPERWYGLLRERMKVEEQRMRVIRDGGIVDYDYLEDLLAQADSLDREMVSGCLAHKSRSNCLPHHQQQQEACFTVSDRDGQALAYGTPQSLNHQKRFRVLGRAFLPAIRRTNLMFSGR